MQCRRCGAQISEDSAYCSSCGQATDERADETANDQLATNTAPQISSGKPHPAAAPVAYAGFWLRAFAWIIDMLVLGIVVGILILNPLLPRAGISPDNVRAMFNSNNPQVLAINLLVLMAEWCYFALLESSAWQASLGKKALGLYVTDLRGNRLSFARASGRYFGMILSTLSLGIGYAMAGFTPKKQALHDLIAGCLVFKKTSFRL